MPKTLNEVGIEKIGRRLVDSADHASYTLNGEPRTVGLFRRIVEGPTARVYVYFDDTIIGEVKDVKLVDTDGDVIASVDRAFTKPPSKGLYVAFKYTIKEVEVESNESI